MNPPSPLRNTRLLIALFLGQFLSVLLCGTGVTSQLLVSRHDIAVPTTQTFISYVLLGGVYGVPVAVRSDFLSVLRRNWWRYILLGVVDMEANFLIVLAYKYTNLTSVQVCVCAFLLAFCACISRQWFGFKFPFLPSSLSLPSPPPAARQLHHSRSDGSLLHLPESALQDHQLHGGGPVHGGDSVSGAGRYSRLAGRQR